MSTAPELFYIVDVKDIVTLVLGGVSFVIGVIVILIRAWLERRRELRRLLRSADD